MNIQLIAEIMGTVAFAISGAMLAIERKWIYLVSCFWGS